MRRPTPYQAVEGAPNLFAREEPRGASFWTVGLGEPPATHGERIVGREGVHLRHFDPASSKLAAALTKEYDGPLPHPGESWLYLGAASGTTASHLADLVGRTGAVYAVEKSLRPFLRLLAVAERYPNLLPILADARSPEEYLGSVPPVDGLYADVAQPDQVPLARSNARLYLKGGGRLLLALKTSSMGRERSAAGHLEIAVRELARGFDLLKPVELAPFHRRHYFLAGEATRGLLRDEEPSAAGPGVTTERRAGRRS